MRLPTYIAQIIVFFIFLSSGIGSYLILSGDFSLNTIIQIFVTLILLMIMIIRFGFPKINHSSRNLVLFLVLFPAVLFIYLLVLSTGGFSSPFLILTHFFSIGLAFLISPQISIAYTLATMITIIFPLAYDQTTREFISQGSFVTILYLLAYLVLIPLSYILAREYKFREEWSKILEQEIATSNKQEEELLKNIKDPVFVLDNSLNLIYFNQAAMNLTGYSADILGKKYFETFIFKDKDGRTLAPYQLPLNQTIELRTQSLVEDIQMTNKEARFLHIDLKLLPAIGSKGSLGIILIAEDRSTKDASAERKKTTILLTLARFFSVLNSQRKQLQLISGGNVSESLLGSLLEQNRKLERLATDFIYTLRLESGEIGVISSLIDLGDLMQEIIFDQKQLAWQYGVVLTHIPKAEVIPLIPKGNLRVPVKKMIFPSIYTIGNTLWMKDSIDRILELIFFLSKKGDKIEVDVRRLSGLVQISINTQINIPAEGAVELFEKFYGKLSSLQVLSETSGFEGFIAKSLIARMGGNIKVENRDQRLIFIITFGEKEPS